MLKFSSYLFQGSSRSSWVDSPLISAAKNGWLCILDGIDRADVHCLLTLRSLLQDGRVGLPSGETVVAQNGFRVVAIGLSTSGPGKQNCCEIIAIVLKI